MKQIILFGAGFFGEAAYYKLSKFNDILFYVDNDKNKTGKSLHGIEIIDVPKLQQIYDAKIMDIVISSQYFIEIGNQLCNIGIYQYYVISDGLLYHKKQGEGMLPCVMGEPQYYSSKSDKKSILFVQNVACIRTHKIASALKKYGWNVFLAYSVTSPEQSNPEYANIYDEIFSISSIRQFIEFINKSDFDFIHSSNEPDFLTMILNQTNKTIIHDCHDLSSAYKSMSPEEMFIELEANRNSSGVIYTTKGIRDEALKKFNIPKEKTFVLENLISQELAPQKKYKKISATDHELHCVYEGGIVPHDKESHRYFEDIWKRLADSGVHVHFYTNCDKEYCVYLESLHEKIHYEGNFSSKQLAEEMTKYDVGLCILNSTEKNKQYLEYASPNKIQEYINAGIPVAIGNILSQKQFVEKNGFGKAIDFNGDIFEQIRNIVQIEIEDNILQKKGLTLESKIPKLINFYETCKYLKSVNNYTVVK